MAETLKRLGKYEILEEIGRGAFAVVYKGRDTDLDRIVALKVLHLAFKEDPNFLARFKREAQIVAKLEHSHIVPVYDFSEHKGMVYLVMRYVEGETLKTHLKKGALPPGRILEILKPVAEALAYAHEQGVLHRDIKPSNIMLTPEGGIFLTDFGLARMVQSGESTLSQDMMIGTPQYMSPEQAQGEQVDERTDIYSLGVVVYEMLTGKVPFGGTLPLAIVRGHADKPPPKPSRINPDVSPAVEAVVLKALAKKREERYQSAMEIARALEEAIEAKVQIFLSYAQEDKKKVEDLYQRLSEAGFKPWMDKRDILPGERWKYSIQEAIRRSHFFLACLSANSVNKRGFFQREINDALDVLQEMLGSDIYLIPVRLEDCKVLESLRDFQWVNLFEEDGWTRLVKAIQIGMKRRVEVLADEEPFPGIERATPEEGPERVQLEERYQSAGKMAEALKKAVHGAVVEEVEAQPIVAPEMPSPEDETPAPLPAEPVPAPVPTRPALPKWGVGIAATVVVVALFIIWLVTALVSGDGPTAMPTPTSKAAALAPTVTLTTALSKTPTPVPPTSTPLLPTLTDTPMPTHTPTPTPTPTVAIAATQTASADEETATLQAATMTTAAAFTPAPIPTQTPVPPTATATDTPKPATPPPAPIAVPQPAGPIALTLYFRGTPTETGFVALSGDQVLNGGMLYEEGKFMYGEAAVQIGDTVYRFDKPEVEPGEPEQLPDPWRVEFEFAEALVARTGNQAGFNAKKAQFWVGTLDGSSAVGEENPYSLTMRLYEGNELRESIQVFFTVKDAPEGGGGGGGEGKPIPSP